MKLRTIFAVITCIGMVLGTFQRPLRQINTSEFEIDCEFAGGFADITMPLWWLGGADVQLSSPPSHFSGPRLLGLVVGAILDCAAVYLWIVLIVVVTACIAAPLPHKPKAP